MEELIQPLIALIVILLTLFLGNTRRKRAETRPTQAERQADEPTSREEELPPFMENFPFDTEKMPDFLATEEANTEETEAPAVAETREETPAESRSVPADVVPPSREPVAKPVPGSLIRNFSSETFRQGIILAAILAPPKARRLRQGYKSEEF